VAGFSPSQTAFTGGEISSRLRARVDSELYRKALARCENFQVLPQGPVRMRAGSQYVATWPEGDAPRLFEFRVSGATEDYVIAVGASKVRIYSKLTGLLAFRPNLIVNGGFDASLASWTASGLCAWVQGRAQVPGYNPSTQAIEQSIATVAGNTYALSFRVRRDPALGVIHQMEALAGGVSLGTTTTTLEWTTVSYTFTGTGSPMVVRFVSTGSGGPTLNYLDDVVVYNQSAATISEFNSPWTAGQLAELQNSAELSKGRCFFVHRNVQPRVLSMPLPGALVFEFYPAEFSSQPASWSGTNWPGVVEAGFQGRLWLASTADDPHNLWASKSGSPFDFGLGATVEDGIAVTVTTKGRLEWMQGQRVLLAGSEAVEHHIQGSQGLIAQADIDIQDGSAFGSAPVQARHIGDQAIFVGSNHRKLRALDYSWERQAWYSRALTFAAEDLFDSNVVEVHWSQHPEPTLIALLEGGELRCCTYDRGEEVAAWWRIAFPSSSIKSAAVARTADGDEVWVAATRGDAILLERIPLHETRICHLDSSLVELLPVGQVVSGLAHLNGETVYAVVDGALEGPFTVLGGAITVAAESPVTADVGLAFTATMITLPLEVAGPGGSAQAAKRRRTKVRLRLNDSALPLVNGYRAADRTPASPLDRVEPRMTGDSDLNMLGWDEDGVLTITQDVPFRTEILGIFGDATKESA